MGWRLQAEANPSISTAEEYTSDDEGLNLLAGGGGAQDVESNGSGDAGVNEVAPAA